MPDEGSADALPVAGFQRALDGLARAGSRMGAPMKEACARGVLAVAARPELSRLTGWLSDREVAPGVLMRALKAYIRAYDVDLADVAEPLDTFRTFNAFFTRALRPGARPIDPDPDVLVAPADSRVSDIGRVPVSGMLDQVKGRRYRLAALLGDEGEAGRFREGSHATLYLSPRDYHRVHCPVDGEIVAWRHIPGRLFPVNSLAVHRVDGLFTVNERIVVHIRSQRFGDVAVVFVGASNVGRITLSFPGAEGTSFGAGGPTTVRPPAPLPIDRGDELGVFNLGSTVVLLASDPSLRATAALPGEHVQVGQPLLRAASG